MKFLKHTILSAVCILVVLVGIFIIFEIFGATVNHISNNIQTTKLKDSILNELPAAEIIDTYSETGNTGGTGNHVDMLSAVIFKTDYSKTEIENMLNNIYDPDDEWGYWIEDMCTIMEYHENKHIFSFCDKMDVPEDLKNCYMIYLNKSAPFAGNIEGH